MLPGRSGKRHRQIARRGRCDGSGRPGEGWRLIAWAKVAVTISAPSAAQQKIDGSLAEFYPVIWFCLWHVPVPFFGRLRSAYPPNRGNSNASLVHGDGLIDQRPPTNVPK
jgi:hypothetical protein